MGLKIPNLGEFRCKIEAPNFRQGAQTFNFALIFRQNADFQPQILYFWKNNWTKSKF